MRGRNATPAELLAAQWGKRLRSARIDRGFTQTTLAAACGHQQTTISRFERGQGTWSHEYALLFAAVLGYEIDDLFPWPPGLVYAERFRLGLDRDHPIAVGAGQ